MSWLDPVRRALEERVTPCTVFFRDDDAGRDDARLAALLSCFSRHGVVVDLAVIPALVTPSLADDLGRRLAAGEVRVHQHGLAHVDHEVAGRKHEFGPARSAAQQAADLGAGRDLMLRWFGAAAVDPVFTPPWNRCTADTGRALLELGLRVLSRDSGAAPLDVPGLVEVPVTLDWFGHRKGVRWTRRELGARLATQVAGPDPIGVMLHHAVTEPGELALVAELVALLAGHPAVRPGSLLGQAGLAEPTGVRR